MPGIQIRTVSRPLLCLIQLKKSISEEEMMATEDSDADEDVKEESEEENEGQLSR